MKRIVSVFVIWVLVLVPALVATAGSFGRLKRNIELEQAFTEGRPPTEYHYYATGRWGVPDAVLGLDPKYEQTARFWRKIEPESDELLDLIQSLMPYLNQEPRAADVLTPDGTVIGVYWSRLYWTRVVMGEDNTVRVFKPILPEEGGAYH